MAEAAMDGGAGDGQVDDKAASSGVGDGDAGASGDAGNGDAGAGSQSGGSQGDGGSSSAGDAGGSGGDSGADGGAQASAVPENWRDIIAGDKDSDPEAYGKRLKQLGRYATFDKFSEAFWNASKEASNRAKSQPLPENPTEEQIADYRAVNGIPETPDKYELTLDGGLVLSEEDKSLLNPFIESAHKANLRPEALSAIVNTWAEQRDEAIAQIEKRDKDESEETAEALRQEWGSDYRTNMAVAKDFMSRLPESVREDFAGARMANGQALLNNPDMMNFLVEMERMVNPTATVVPNSVDAAKSIDEELSSIKEVMRTDRARYNRDEKMQARYRELLGAQERLSGK